MTSITRVVIVAMAAVVAAGGTARTQTQNQTQPQVEPDAMAALKNMGTYLRSLKAFEVNSVTTTEEVLADGQKVQFDSTLSALARMPDRLRISVEGDQHDRLWVYDGKEFTLLARRVNYYATIPAPPTIAQLADLMDQKFDMNLPLEDLFRWGGPQSQEAAITSAMVIGPSQIGGVSCGHYAFRQPGLDWQVWIQLGDYPLPRKLVLTTTTDEARPQFTATYMWNLAPSYDDGAFSFVPPPGANKVVLAEVK
jgi:hypothetical protein